MNSVCTDITESLQDNFLDEFEKTEQEEQEERLREYIGGLSKEFLLTAKEPYEHILELPDELEISDYVGLLRNRAGELKCKGELERRVKPYVQQATEALKQAKREKRLQAAYDKAKAHGKDLANYPYIKTKVYEDGSVTYYVCCPLLAKYIREHCHFITIHDRFSETDRMFWYDGGVYKPVSDNMFMGYIKKFITDFDETILKMRDVKEVMQDLKTDLNFVREQELNADEDIINFQNGIYSLSDNKLYPHSPDILSTIQIPCNYNPDNTLCPHFAHYIYDLSSGDKDKTELLLEYMAVAISNICGYRMKKALFMYGKGDTGKSQLKALTERLLGSENCSAGDLSELEERFGTSALYMKRLYGSGDMSFLGVKELKIFKCVTGGDEFFLEFKGKNGMRYKYSGLLWFCTNELPQFGGDRGEWVYNRIIALDCNNVIPKSKQDKKLLDKMFAEREGIINMLIPALQRVIANGYNFTVPQSCKDNLAEYMDKNSPVRMFYKECCTIRNNGRVEDDYTTGKIFKAFKLWYSDNYGRGSTLSNPKFKKELAEILGFPSADSIEIRKSDGRYYPVTLNYETAQAYKNLLIV